MSIRQAAICSQIYYPTAKAIHKIYIAEKRIDKKLHRFRKITPVTGSKAGNALSNNSLKGQSSTGQGMDAQGCQQEKVTMLKPIREELDLGYDIYESLDEGEVDVTEERISDARQQNMPFDHFRITQAPEDEKVIKILSGAEAIEQSARTGCLSAASESPMEDGEPACLSSATGTEKNEDGQEGHNGMFRPVSHVSAMYPQLPFGASV